MTPVVVDGGTTEDAANAAVGEPETPVEENYTKDSLYSRQKALEHQDKNAKRKFTNGLSAFKYLMLIYENTWFDLQVAKEITSKYVLLNDRYKKVVETKQDIQDCICKNIDLTDEEFEKELDKIDAQIEKYTTLHMKFKEDSGKIVDKAYNCIRLNTETKTKHPTNNSENTFTHRNTSTNKDSEEKDEETEKLKNPTENPNHANTLTNSINTDKLIEVEEYLDNTSNT